MSELKQIFRDRVKEIKKDTGLTQAEIAKYLGYSRSYLSELLGDQKDGRGKVEQHHLEQLNKTTFTTSTQQPTDGDDIAELISSNKILAEANRRLAEAHYIIAENESELIKRLPIVGSMVTGEPVVDLMYRFVHEYLVPKGLISPEELRKVLGSFQSSDSKEVKASGKSRVEGK